MSQPLDWFNNPIPGRAGPKPETNPRIMYRNQDVKMPRKQTGTQPLVDWYGNVIPGTVPPAPGTNPCIAKYGTGPEGKICKDCSHLKANVHAKVYYKCDQREITNGPKTDHKVSWPACAKFQPR